PFIVGIRGNQRTSSPRMTVYAHARRHCGSGGYGWSHDNPKRVRSAGPKALRRQGGQPRVHLWRYTSSRLGSLEAAKQMSARNLIGLGIVAVLNSRGIPHHHSDAVFEWTFDVADRSEIDVVTERI